MSRFPLDRPLRQALFKLNIGSQEVGMVRSRCEGAQDTRHFGDSQRFEPDMNVTNATCSPAFVEIAPGVLLITHTMATGGVLVIDRQQPMRLTPIQLALLIVLKRQSTDDEEKHSSIRGFVSSCELLGTLPWDTTHPDLCHLKQLVRRMRRKLASRGINIEACCGLGYRLTL